MSIVTKGGDKGETSLLGGRRVSKTDPLVEAYGDVDELNASIGTALAYVEDSNVLKVLEQVQHDLFKIGAELSATGSKFTEYKKINSENIQAIEEEVYRVEKELPKQTKFILPAGNPSSSHLHFARTVCRRAERKAVLCKASENVIMYLNRLSDLLFIYARLENKGQDKTVEY